MRIDKITHGFRARAGTVLSGLKGVALNSGGSAVPSGTATAERAVGVVMIAGSAAAGDVISVFTRAEIVEFGGSVGTKYYAGTGGVVGTASTNAQSVGTTVEGDRLVVLM